MSIIVLFVRFIVLLFTFFSKRARVIAVERLITRSVSCTNLNKEGNGAFLVVIAVEWLYFFFVSLLLCTERS